MSRVEIPTTTITRMSVAPPSQTDADAANDHFIAENDGRVFLEIVSTDAATQSVIFETPYTLDSLSLEDVTVYVGPGATRYSGPWPTHLFNQTGSTDVDRVFLNPSVSTTLKFRAFRI